MASLDCLGGTDVSESGLACCKGVDCMTGFLLAGVFQTVRLVSERIVDSEHDNSV